MHETSGVLRPVVEAYLHGRALNDAEIGIMRKYLYQWVTLGDWREPRIDTLAETIASIHTREQLELIIGDLVSLGMDPL